MQQSFSIMGRPKPHPGDFDGDGRLDVIWDNPQADDEIWLFESTTAPTVVSAVVPDDTTPIVGDFDGDDCSDILWYRGHAPTSQLWRSACDGTFEMSALDTPQAAAPVGYAYGHGRAFHSQN
jgi:hypothetical protein